MKKVAKAILIALGIILVIGAVAVLGVNLYVQSAGTHARIQVALGKGLRTPVKIGSLSFMPWHGLKLTSIAAQDPKAAASGNSLEISSIGMRFQLLKLLQHDVVIKQLTVDGVKVSWTQNAEGKWEVPLRQGATAVEPVAPAPSDQPVSVPPSTQTPPAPAAPEEPVAQEQPKVTIDHARMRDSTFNFYDSNHKLIAALTGVFVQSPSPTEKLVAGTAGIGRLAVQNVFYIQDWQGSFKYSPAELSLFDTSSKIGGGMATGTLDVKIAEQDSPFVLDVNYSGVNLDHLLADAGISQWQASGTLAGTVHLEGNLHDSKQATGKGRIFLTNGTLTKSDITATLQQFLRTDKFQKITLDDAHADFHVGGGMVFLDELIVKSPVLTLTSKGAMVIKGGDLFIKNRLAIDSAIVRQIPSFLMESFTLDEATGARYVDFDIGGTTNHPTQNLTKILGKKIEKSAGDLFKKWLNGGQKGGAQPVPAPQPAPAQPVDTAPAQ